MAETVFVLHSAEAIEVTDYSIPGRRPFLLARYAQRLGDLPLYARRAKLEEGETSDSIAEFADLARAACGRQLLAALRLDADNAGMLISEGLKTPDLASVGALCRQISRFFTVYLDYICQGNLGAWAGKVAPCRIAHHGSTAPRSLVIIYSGGEDLFLVGAWSEVAEVAFEIQQAYKLFTAENPDIDLSAGITLHKPKFPVYQMARLAGEALAKAKGNLQDCRVREECKKAKEECLFFHPHREKIRCAARKGSVALFYTSELAARNEKIREDMTDKGIKFPEDRITLALSWSQARDEVVCLAQFFVRYFGKPQEDRVAFSLPTADFRRLFDLVEVWRQEGALYLPWLETFWRTIQQKLAEQDASGDWQNELHQIRGPLDNNLSSLHLSLSWLENLRRREGEENGR